MRWDGTYGALYTFSNLHLSMLLYLHSGPTGNYEQNSKGQRNPSNSVTFPVPDCPNYAAPIWAIRIF